MENTLVILKPDAVQRRLIGKIISRFEEKGLQIVGMKLMRISEALARKNYGIHEGKDFYKPLIKFMTSGPVVAVVVRGKVAVGIVRKMLGATFGCTADPGTIRGDFGVSNRFNLVHGSDSPESAEREIALFFTKDELVNYEPTDLSWVYDLSGKEPV
ncbi:MAG: nucleoside-diphosphate kinase [Planctomycetota bacterium]